jgi:hypothetical protein
LHAWFVLMFIYLWWNTIEGYQVGALIRESPTTWSGDRALCELQVPLAQWLAPDKGPFPGLRGGEAAADPTIPASKITGPPADHLLMSVDTSSCSQGYRLLKRPLLWHND